MYIFRAHIISYPLPKPDLTAVSSIDLSLSLSVPLSLLSLRPSLSPLTIFSVTYKINTFLFIVQLSHFCTFCTLLSSSI